MPSFDPFSYSECLPLRSRQAIPSLLQIRQKASEEVLLLRLLTGTIDIKNNVTGAKLVQRTNYTLFEYQQNSRISAKTIFNVYTNDNISQTKFVEYYTECFKFGNRTLFKNLLLELANFFYQKQKNSHATAFLHLYRSFELVSYCFPLFYASKSTSYEKTFVSLKEYFAKVDGERPFFKKFVHEHLFQGDLRLDQSLSINITAPKPILQQQYFEALKKLCDNNKAIDIKSSAPNNQIVISRRGLTSLIIDLRNRYFHLLTGDFNEKFSSGELSEVDNFFFLVNDIILNWISVIYFQILKKTIDR